MEETLKEFVKRLKGKAPADSPPSPQAKGTFRYGVDHGVCYEVVLEGADGIRVWGGTFTYCPGGPEEAVKFAANRKPELCGEIVKVYKLLPESKIGATWAELVGTFKVPPAL